MIFEARGRATAMLGTVRRPDLLRQFDGLDPFGQPRFVDVRTPDQARARCDMLRFRVDAINAKLAHGQPSDRWRRRAAAAKAIKKGQIREVRAWVAEFHPPDRTSFPAHVLAGLDEILACCERGELPDRRHLRAVRRYVRPA